METIFICASVWDPISATKLSDFLDIQEFFEKVEQAQI